MFYLNANFAVKTVINCIYLYYAIYKNTFKSFE